ncbi:flavin reductase [Psychrobacter sp. FDAARGOS_221]|uniref:flavin reductase n=1 Tax=Psychrobacter sp. FDAARGOS_221 TaxID=1975705 RepID=UPI000BB54EBF|nr:flavin reductase [Psychrobacter sp. FDAARGOS_221]PNK60868.1 flavin reductase [Psychrobacter sp. FDAARGOS_221]
MIEATDFRNGMSLLATAVNVVTTEGAAGRYGFTASAVCSVTDTPPTLLVCMNQATRSHANFVENKTLSVNVLGAHQEHISNAFASPLDSEQRFEHGSWTKLETGSPILEEALVSFDCEIESTQTVGTHSVFMCRVVAIKQENAPSTPKPKPLESLQPSNVDIQSLIYFNRAYHHVG